MIRQTIPKTIDWILSLWFLILFVIPGYPKGENEHEADLDPIAFRISVNKSQVKVGEELEVTITAIKRPNWDFRLANQVLDTDFRIKVVFPDGFQQTGGNYIDFIGGRISDDQKHREYKIKGIFTKSTSSATFMLLRGTKNSVEIDKFLFRSEIIVKVISDSSDKVISPRTALRTSEASINCSGYVFSENQVIGNNGPGNNVIIHLNNGCAVAYWANSGSRTHKDWLAIISGKTIPDNVLSSCVKWEGEALNCSVSCVAPTISKTSGTTVCATTNQTVTLSASNCSGTITWFKDGVQVGTGNTITRNDPGNYTATCSVGSCTSTASPAIAITQTNGCGTSTGCIVNKVRLQFRIPGDCCMDRLAGAKIQGSNNGSSWADLYTFTANGTTSWQEFSFANTTSFSSLRFSASNTGWGELAELEFYNGNTKLSGTPFGTDNFAVAFDNNNTTMWHAQASAGPQNVAGLNLTGCGGATCTTPAAPTITKTAGTTVCNATNQNVTLSATNCSGTITWFKDGAQVGTGSTITRNDAGNYTATCTVSGCTSAGSGVIAIAQTSNCLAGCSTLRNPENPTTVSSGLDYKYYENSANWCSTASLGGLTASKAGTVSNLSLTNRNKEENFGFEFSGYLDVPTDGEYTFYLLSDDASSFYIGTQLVTSYESCHGADTEQFGKVCLKAGKHAIKTLFTQGGGGYSITLNWSGPGINKQLIPDNRLYRSATCVSPNAPTITKTNGTTACATTNQTVTLSASNCSGTITWFKDGVQVGTGNTITRNDPGNYTATCSVGSCTSTASPAIAITQTNGCGTSTGCVVNKVRLQFRIPGDCCMDRLAGAKIQGSNNGSSWADLYTFTVNGTTTWQEFSFANTTSYSSLRFSASNTGWGELVELEFYNGNTKLSGTPFGTDNFAVAFDNNNTTMWHAQASAGPQNIAGLNLTGCGGTTCTTPAAPTITKTAGTTVCNATNQTVTLSATNCSGTLTWFKDGAQVGTGSTITRNDAGNYTATCTVSGCTSAGSGSIVVAQTAGCGEVSGTTLGAYSKTIGGREFTYNRTPRLELEFNSNGTITDVTANMTFDGSTNKVGNRRVFYMVGYSVFGNTQSDGSKTYNRLQNLYLPDGIYSIRQFLVDENICGNMNDFVQKLTGWNNGVNKTNAELSEINLTIKTIGSTSNVFPDWLKVSRGQLLSNGGVNIPADGTFSTYNIKMGYTPAQYQAIGINTETMGTPNVSQPNTWKVWKWGVDGSQPSEQDLYNQGKSLAQQFSFGPNTVVSDEFPENTQGTDPNIEAKMHSFYQGILDYIRINNPNINKNRTNLYGSYGADGFSKLVDAQTLGRSRQIFVESLTSKVHKRLDPSTGEWGGDCIYYTSGDIDVRNINLDYYMYNDVRMIPYELCYLNERVKIGTKTYGGQNRESKWLAMTWASTQSLVRDNNGYSVGIEENHTGNIIPFPNGEIIARNNTPAVWDEYLPLGFYSTWLGNGIALWGGFQIGEDPNKVKYYIPSNEVVKWIPRGGSQSDYSSGSNGAPLNDLSGLQTSLHTSPIDAAYAGWKLAKALKGRSQVIYHASYSSNKGNLTAIPGNEGLHLNGFGVLNYNLFVVKDAYDGKKGLALVGEGSEGRVAVYYNGFLSAQEYEDNVIINHSGTQVNIGRVYGRKIAVVNF